MLDKLTRANFEKCLNQKFLIHVSDQEPLETELIEVRGLVPPDDDPDRRPPFSLIFRGPADATLQQAVFKLENETMGEIEIFLVTVGPDDEGLRHEAIFN